MMFCKHINLHHLDTTTFEYKYQISIYRTLFTYVYYTGFWSSGDNSLNSIPLLLLPSTVTPFLHTH